MAFWNNKNASTSVTTPAPVTSEAKSLSTASPRRGWFTVFESFAGAWQRNVEVKPELALAYHAVFSCVTLISSDIAKLRARIVEETPDGIWVEKKRHALKKLLRKPNDTQTAIQFWENYFISKLTTGNTYVLKRRSPDGKISSLHVLNPMLVQVLVSPQGAVFYQLNVDDVSGLTSSVTVPASEIIHDRFNCFFHPLVGLSPIYASGLAAKQGLTIQQHSDRFFGNNALPSGIISVPGAIEAEDAAEIKRDWEAGYSGKNAGKLAVISDGMEFKALAIPAQSAQLIEQLRWTAEVVCSTFHVPPYKIGIGTLPTYNNIQALNVEYYSQCLQTLIESAEDCMDDGLGFGESIGVEFNVDVLLRMDGMTMATRLKEEVGAGIRKPNEARKAMNLPAVEGGDTPYLQQQNYSLSALNKRDAREDPFATVKPENKPEILPLPESDVNAKAIAAFATKAAEIFKDAA
ncbi:phage portal protein [Brucella pituitosa]|uniref:phage portal protein n=1 Tax=Brucella pituitosa TaxID=571256 RepID=UPI003F4AB8BF